MISHTLKERQLREDVLAMRHLPPGTQLRRSSNETLEHLFADLLRLPDEVDPLLWLQRERGSVAARIALWLELLDIRKTTQEIRRGAQEGWPLRRGEVAVLGELLELADDKSLFAQLESTAVPSPDTLVAVLRQLRTLRGVREEEQPPPGNSTNDRWNLLAELMRLPDSIDVLHWLQTEQSAAAVRVVAEEVLEQHRPPRTLLVGPIRQALYRSQALRGPHGVRVTVEELAFGRSGFRFSADIRLSERGMALTPEAKRDEVIFLWQGFDRVVDDLGNHYLVQHRVLNAGTGFLCWQQEKLHMAFYPAVAPSTGKLTFVASPMTFAVIHHVLREGRVRLLPDHNAGDLTWHVTVPHPTTR